MFYATIALHLTARSKPSMFVHGVYLFWAAISDVWHSERESVFIDAVLKSFANLLFNLGEVTLPNCTFAFYFLFFVSNYRKQ